MSASDRYLSPAEAARRLGVSTKALRLYEQHGLVVPTRTRAYWRAYGDNDMARAGRVVALRGLGFSLAEIGNVIDGDPGVLAAALARHQATLRAEMKVLAGRFAKAGTMAMDIGVEAGLLGPESPAAISFDLPWPWGGERFDLTHIRRLTYIVGPLGSGKTRLARALALASPGAVFLGLDRLDGDEAVTRERLREHPALAGRVEAVLAGLCRRGATLSPALRALIVGLEDQGPEQYVVDMVEEGLDQSTQTALIGHLRQRQTDRRPIFMLTRSNAILDLDEVGAEEAIILCPANHSPPMLVQPFPGAAGFEAVATCLAAPEVRARTAGVIAWRQPGENAAVTGSVR